jgi:hypothetical protein
MRLIKPAFIILSIVAGICGEAFALTHSRTYGWGTERGNLIPNWSFENPMQFWTLDTSPGVSVNPRFKPASTTQGGGSFVGMASGTCQVTNCERMSSELFPILPDRSYTLSFYYQAASLSGGATFPEVWFYKDKLNVEISHMGGNFTATTGWIHYTTNFTAPPGVLYAKLILASSDVANAGGTFSFDNVILEEGWLSSTEVKANRDRIIHSASFGDALGRTHQTHSRVGLATYLVGETRYEDFARPETTFLAVPATEGNPAFLTNTMAGAQAFYNGSAGPNAGGYPFSEVQYANEPGGRILASSAPGATWRLASTHAVKQGF